MASPSDYSPSDAQRIKAECRDTDCGWKGRRRIPDDCIHCGGTGLIIVADDDPRYNPDDIEDAKKRREASPSDVDARPGLPPCVPCGGTGIRITPPCPRCKGPVQLGY